MEKEIIIKEIVNIINKRLAGNYKILLFGSWAKGDALETSDIDIGILGDKDAPQNLMAEIRQEIDNLPTLRKIDVVDLNLVEDNFKNSVLQYAKPLSP